MIVAKRTRVVRIERGDRPLGACEPLTSCPLIWRRTRAVQHVFLIFLLYGLFVWVVFLSARERAAVSPDRVSTDMPDFYDWQHEPPFK